MKIILKTNKKRRRKLKRIKLIKVTVKIKITMKTMIGKSKKIV